MCLLCPSLNNKATVSSDEEEHPVVRRPRRKISSPREKEDAEVHPDVEPPVIEGGSSAWRPEQEEPNTSTQDSTGPQQPRKFRLPTEGE